jgi:hypothetical protein
LEKVTKQYLEAYATGEEIELEESLAADNWFDFCVRVPMLGILSPWVPRWDALTFRLTDIISREVQISVLFRVSAGCLW